MSTSTANLRTDFLDFIFSDFPGYICLATQDAFDKASFKQFFFKWPEARGEVESFLDLSAQTKNCWFCVNLLAEPIRRKEHCLPTNLVWADLDDVNPTGIEPRPQVIIESSPARFQAIWRLDQTVQPYAAEDYSRRIAYHVGADKSGWDLTQLLRVPFTKNLKYGEAPQVELLSSFSPMLPIEIFEALDPPPLSLSTVESDHPIPDLTNLPDPLMIGYKYHHHFRHTGLDGLLNTEPTEDADWSVNLWRLLRLSFEAGCSRDEVLSLALYSPWNKYARDGRSVTYLWRDVCKAEIEQRKIEILVGTHATFEMPTLVGEVSGRTIIDDYTDWAVEATDAVPAFHPLCGFMVLSAILAGNLTVNTSYGPMHPHLWGLVLGNSTISRKTTAMNLATSFISQLDREIVIATEGSMEGLLTGLSLRNGMVSMFFKDEVTGFFDAIKHKEYLAGMPEMLTHLYDAPTFFTRRLRKESISVSNPIFMFFGGGIRRKFYELIDESMILSGFLPRFLVVSGDADISSIRVTGPATVSNLERRQALSVQFANMYEAYNQVEQVEILGQRVNQSQKIEVILSPEAWKFYGEIEMQMVATAENTTFQELSMPTFERLSRSLLKMACLLAAARQVPDGGYISCSVADLEQAAKYVQVWGNYSIDLLQNCGKSVPERLLDRILARVTAQPGILRGELMRTFHLGAKDMTEIERTLEQRGQVMLSQSGKATRFTAV